MLFELDKLTTDCEKFSMLKNISLWRTDSEFEKMVGCFTAALDHLGFKVEMVQLASVHLETHVVRGLLSFHICMDGNETLCNDWKFLRFFSKCLFRAFFESRTAYFGNFFELIFFGSEKFENL